MTWTECSECRKATYAYVDTCEHCGAAFDGGVRPLFGMGGGPLEQCNQLSQFDRRLMQRLFSAMQR